jgi:hypothetical protein
VASDISSEIRDNILIGFQRFKRNLVECSFHGMDESMNGQLGDLGSYADMGEGENRLCKQCEVQRKITWK